MDKQKEMLKGFLEDLDGEEFRDLKWYLREKKIITASQMEEMDRRMVVDKIFETHPDNPMYVAKEVFQKISKNDLVQKLDAVKPKTSMAKLTGTFIKVSGPSQETVAICRKKLQSTLKKMCQDVFEWSLKAGMPTLTRVYTEPHIALINKAAIVNEHEVQQIEMASRNHVAPERAIERKDIFKASTAGQEVVRLVLTQGVAGIGKTVLTQKFLQDWVEGDADGDIQLIFPLTFKALGALENDFNLVDLIHHFFPETNEICSFEKLKVMFVLDGLDEYPEPLNFDKDEKETSVKMSLSVNLLLKNLIKGNLLPSARIWITTRPAAAHQIPSWCVSKMTEVQGFTNSQKEEYFGKRCRDEGEAKIILDHVKKSQSLCFMCHIPIFCWITASVLESALEYGRAKELPKTLTETYIRYVVMQLKEKNMQFDGVLDTDPHWTEENRKIVLSLAKLAFEHLKNSNFIFSKDDLKASEIGVQEAVKYTETLPQIFQEVKGSQQCKMFYFIHLSIQEFFAALHVHVTFLESGINVLSDKQPSWLSKVNLDKTKNFYQSALDEAWKSENGHLDLVLRFLLGLSVRTNQALLDGLCTTRRRASVINRSSAKLESKSDKIVKMVKNKISDSHDLQKTNSMFHCLNELNDQSLIDDIQQHLSSGGISRDTLSASQWAALVFVLLSSGEEMKMFDLKKYDPSEATLERLVAVIKIANQVQLSSCNLSERGCKCLAGVLSAQSNVVELDLSNNNLQDKGVSLLIPGLKSSDCSVKTLRLSLCNLTEKSCEALSSALSSASKLRELDLSNNDLRDSGVKLLSEGLKSQQCHLRVLSLSGCLVTKDGCSSLAAALDANPSRLRTLDLSYNNLGKTGEELLSNRKNWKLKTLRFDNGGDSRMKPGLKKYSRDLRLDKKTASEKLKLSDDDKTAACPSVAESYLDHPDGFDDRPQLLCRDAVSGRCYWEVPWKGEVDVAVTTDRKAETVFGQTDKSWRLRCKGGKRVSLLHDGRKTQVLAPGTGKVAVFWDQPAGVLSFYMVDQESRIHLHTFSTAAETLYPGFGIWPCSSITLLGS